MKKYFSTKDQSKMKRIMTHTPKAAARDAGLGEQKLETSEKFIATDRV